jgi:enediyne biosynthesis protein E4
MQRAAHFLRSSSRRSRRRLLCPLLCWLCFLWSTSLPAESWQTGPGFRYAPLPVPATGKTGFSRLPTAQTGLNFTNTLPEARFLTNQILPNGSGVAAGDIDRDGWCDLFFCGLGGGSRLFRNLGNWKFEDITAQAGVGCPDLDATGALWADVDGNGSLDLLVSSIGGGTRLFLNDGKGHFTRDAQTLNAGNGGTSLALAAPFNPDRLALYLANYRVSTLMDAPGTRFNIKMVNGEPVVASIDGKPLTDPEWTNRFRFKFGTPGSGRMTFGREELGQPDAFYNIDRQGRCERVSWTGGTFLDETGQPLTQPPFDWGLSVMFRDFNGDGLPDLYICDDFNSPDRFWLNDGHGHFRAAPKLALRCSSLAAMAVDVADLNRDGHDDFMVVDMLSREHRRRLTQRNMLRSDAAQASEIASRPQYPRNTLFMNRGDGTYAEIAQYAGVDASEWSWGPLFIDVDLDGYEDLLVPNGFERDNMNVDIQNRIKQAHAGKVTTREELALRRLFPRLATENLAFHNRGDFRFEETSQAWGFNTPTISQGACLADLNNDGGLDVIVNNMNDAAGLYRNDGLAPRLAVRLKGLPPNTQGIGAKITVAGGPVTQSQEMVIGGRYLSCDECLRVFAAGTLTNRLRIEVAWRSGKHSEIGEALPNCLYEIDEAGAITVPAATPPPPAPPMFEDVSDHLSNRHQAAAFDDFERQPLLPKQLSRGGPGVCWWDLDGDGRDDLVVGAGKGSPFGWLRNDGQGGFDRRPADAWPLAANREQTALVGWQPGAILAGSANYEDGLESGGAVHLYSRASSQAFELASAWDASAGPMAVADYDGDGALDLFVGGRVKAGCYPAPASSRLYHQQNGKLGLDEANSAKLREIGLVSGAVWSDLDGDGWPDLILACEWGPIRVFHNTHGVLREITRELGLDQYSGWWNGVNTGDFDGDGRLDIVASNWGQNSKYERHREKPLRIYYGDFNNDGGMTFLESYFEPAMNRYVPLRMLDTVTRAMPFLAERFPTHQSWAEASIDLAIQDRDAKAGFGEANWLETTLFLNRGNRFEARILPFEAQLSPAFAVCVADFDGDGREDVFLSQNFFAVDSDTSRYDAGRGLLLRGDGQGGFRAVPGQESGIKIYGEQRGAAVADYDGDGRVDLVVAQNQAETQLFHNIQGKPGLRVILRGAEGNPRGIGARLRLKCGGQPGPAREIHGGSGYWSQDSVIQVLATPAPPTQLWIRWPGGLERTYDVPAGAQAIQAGIDGQLN